MSLSLNEIRLNYILIFYDMVAGITWLGNHRSDNIVHRTELDDALIDVSESFELTNIRSLTECLAVCGGTCHMLSYNKFQTTCRIYSGQILENVRVIGIESGVVFYRLQDCPKGMYLNSSGCISCAAGTYQDEVGSTSCIGCSNSYYQNLAGQENCIPCLNTSKWRYGTNTERTECLQCWEYYNTFTDGDMSQLITSFVANASWVCGYECDRAPGCLLFTWRELESTCYLHSSDDWDWGYVYQSVIHNKLC